MTLDAQEKSRYGAKPVELYRFAVGGSPVYRWTSADEPIASSADGGAQTYTAQPITRGPIDFSQEEGSGSIDVSVELTNPVAQAMLVEGPPSPVTLTVYRLHYGDGEAVVIFIGRVVAAVFESGSCTLKCQPLNVSLKRPIPRLTFQRQCNWSTYGPGCGLNKASFKDSGTVMTFSGYFVRAAIFATRADGWFTGGWMELADGSRRYISDHVGTTVTLRSPFPTLAVGQTFDAYAGDDRTEETCLNKFNNLANHLGFKRIPVKNPYSEGMA